MAELPAYNGIKSNFASYWVNGITTKATGPKLDAAEKFLTFITTPEAMELWMKTVGELPARRAWRKRTPTGTTPSTARSSAASTIRYATDFVDESAQRKVLIDMVDRSRCKNVPTKAALAEAAAEEQKLLDAFYRK